MRKISVFLLLILFIFSCPTNITIDQNGNDQKGITPVTPVSYNAGDTKTFSADGLSFNVVYVPAKSFLTGTSDSGNSSVTNPYWIAENETTYEFWLKVYTWAVSNNYYFQNSGVMGDGSASLTNKHPVTTINWRDAIVWCNALTEWYNEKNSASLTPVYKYSGNVIKDSTDANATACDNAVQDTSATGFRLLSSNEWELAARYISDANDDGDITDAGEYYPGDHASGDTTGYCYDNGYARETLSTIFGNYAWYDGNSSSSTHLVKTTSSVNALGIYDMSGNVYEWNFDMISTSRSMRGGSWIHAADRLQVGEPGSQLPDLIHNSIGFRISINQ